MRAVPQHLGVARVVALDNSRDGLEAVSNNLRSTVCLLLNEPEVTDVSVDSAKSKPFKVGGKVAPRGSDLSEAILCLTQPSNGLTFEGFNFSSVSTATKARRCIL